MADGVVQRIDQVRGVVLIARRGRLYEAPVHDVDSRARVPNVRVRFDLSGPSGNRSATNVTLAEGRHSRRHHRRHGDLVGARVAGDKVPIAAHELLGVDASTQPVRLATEWARAVVKGDVDDAVSLYLPSAQVHTPAGVVEGRTRLLSFLQGAPVSSTGRSPSSIAGEDRDVTIEWSAVLDEPGWHTILSVEHGLIVEQWTEGMEPSEVEETAEGLLVSTRGPVPADAPDFFRQHVGSVIDTIDDPVLFARGKLEVATDPAADRPARAQIAVDVNGSVIRAHGRGTSLQEATMEVAHRLRDRLEHRSDRERHRPVALPAEPGHWRHGNLPTMHPPWFERPPAERELVRHKTPAPAELTVDEAAWDMYMMDYDFFLFRELGSGQDTLLLLAPDGLRLQQAGRADDELDLGATDAEVDREAAAKLSVSEAIERLDAGGERVVFFENATTGRGNVLYVRYDGHYGIVTPRDQIEPEDGSP